MKVRVDRSACTGHAMCNFNAPEVYPLDALGYNALDGEVDIPEALADDARRGALACPEQAITILS